VRCFFESTKKSNFKPVVVDAAVDAAVGAVVTVGPTSAKSKFLIKVMLK